MARKPLITSDIFVDTGARPPKLTAKERKHRYNTGAPRPKALAETATLESGYRPQTSPLELERIREGLTEHRRVSIGRLFTLDLPKAVKRYARGFTRDDRETLRTEALLLIIRWEASGKANPVCLGGADATPYRHVWLSDDGTLSPEAWRAMHAAIGQAARSMERAAGRVDIEEIPTDGVSLGELAQLEAEAQRDTAPLPELRAEYLADALGLTASGARAILYHAYNLSGADASELWGVSRASVPVIVSRGTRELEKRYPEASGLVMALKDLRAAARQIESVLADDARYRLKAYAATGADDDRRHARRVATEWLSVVRTMPEARRIMMSATRKHAPSEAHARALADALPAIVRYAQAHERTRASVPGASALRTVPGAQAPAERVRPNARHGLPLKRDRAQMYARATVALDRAQAKGPRRARR